MEPVALSSVGVASGVGWTGAARLSRAGIQFLVSIVLARLLTPDDFGLFGMILVFSGFATLYADLGFASALIQRRELEERQCSSVFWINVAAGVALTLLLVAAAPLLALLFDEPRLAPMARLLALSFVLSGLAVVQTALLSRQMQFRALGVIDVASAIAGAAAAILLAWLGFGVRSLVWQQIVSTGAQSALLWTVAGWRPRWMFDRRAVAELIPFSANLLGFTSLNYWMRNADNLLIGRALGSHSLGIYTRAYSLMLLPIQQVASVAGRVMFPVLARMQQDAAAVKAIYLRAIRWIALVSFPLMLFLLVAGDAFVIALFGEKWTEVILILRILSLAGLSQSIGNTTGWLYQSTGRTDVMFRWAMGSGVVTLTAFVVGLHWGVVGVAAAYTLRTYLLTYFTFSIPGRFVGLRFSEVISALGSTFTAALGMALVVVALRWMPLPPSPALRLAAYSIGGVASYVALARWLRLDAAAELVDLLSTRLEGLRRSGVTARLGRRS